MEKGLKILGVFLLLCSQQLFSQEKNNETLEFKSENAKRDLVEKTTVFTGNVSLNSAKISFKDAEKVIVEEATGDIKIYKPKNFTIISVDSLANTRKNSEENLIVYNTKTNKLSI
ncbi:hypothetical protein SAMN05443633_11850 [Chryseobacterium arachidis]|uniref:OstA-like protein n=1 Tax=Chryseobacterium arachidis TaxID=1416778 RepID=A0A1M5L402_9FLAO|nr:hypothetical protein [Chryseobacterium arachidis]SHG59747.1 hypothetical protein SAMN05443633_11850 [Chryseobacterium arachidis]